jgi:hypothetical protein
VRPEVLRQLGRRAACGLGHAPCNMKKVYTSVSELISLHTCSTICKFPREYDTVVQLCGSYSMMSDELEKSFNIKSDERVIMYAKQKYMKE